MKFVITERIPTYQTWTYEVEAESETDALEKVLNGDVTAGDVTTDEPDYTLAEYEIEDENGDVFDVERGDEENDWVELERGEMDDDTQDDDEDFLSSTMFGVDNKQ